MEITLPQSFLTLPSSPEDSALLTDLLANQALRYDYRLHLRDGWVIIKKKTESNVPENQSRKVASSLALQKVSTVPQLTDTFSVDLFGSTPVKEMVLTMLKEYLVSAKENSNMSEADEASRQAILDRLSKLDRFRIVRAMLNDRVDREDLAKFYVQMAQVNKELKEELDTYGRFKNSYEEQEKRKAEIARIAQVPQSSLILMVDEHLATLDSISSRLNSGIGNVGIPDSGIKSSSMDYPPRDLTTLPNWSPFFCWYIPFRLKRMNIKVTHLLQLCDDVQTGVLEQTKADHLTSSKASSRPTGRVG